MADDPPAILLVLDIGSTAIIKEVPVAPRHRFPVIQKGGTGEAYYQTTSPPLLQADLLYLLQELPV